MRNAECRNSGRRKKFLQRTLRGGGIFQVLKYEHSSSQLLVFYCRMPSTRRMPTITAVGNSRGHWRNAIHDRVIFWFYRGIDKKFRMRIIRKPWLKQGLGKTIALSSIARHGMIKYSKWWLVFFLLEETKPYIARLHFKLLFFPPF